MGMNKHLYLGPYIECPHYERSPWRYDIVGDEMSDVDTGDESILVLIPNVTRDGSPDREIDWDCTWQVDLQKVDMAAEMNWLRNAFAVEIAALEKAYGSVTFRWGLLQEYS